MPFLCDHSLLNEDNVVYRNYIPRLKQMKGKVIAAVFVVVSCIVVGGIFYYKSIHKNNSEQQQTSQPSIPSVIDNSGQQQTSQPSKPFVIDHDTPPWAVKLIKSIDESTSPCTNFFDYACGRWVNEIGIPSGLTSFDKFTELSRNNMKYITTKMDEGDIHGSAEKKASSFYRSCTSLKRSSRFRIIDAIKRFLAKISSNTYKSILDVAPFRKVVKEINVHDVWPLFSFYSRPDPRNSTKQILTMYGGKSPFALEHEKKTNKLFHVDTSESPKDKFKTLLSDAEQIESSLLKKATSVMEEQSSKNNGKMPEFIEEKDTEIGDISKYTTEEILKIHTAVNKLIFKYFWDASDGSFSEICAFIECPKSEAQKMAENLLDFEIDIFKASTSHKTTGYDEALYRVFTIQELQQSCDIMDWRLYFDEIGISETEEINVLGHENIISVCGVVKNAQTPGLFSDKKKVLQNFLLVQMVKSIAGYYFMELLIDKWETKDETNYNASLWYKCILMTDQAYGLATSAIFIRGTSYQEHIQKVQDIMKYVKKSFRMKTLRHSWLDSTTQTAAIKKLDNMIDKIGYPDYIMNRTFVDEYYYSTDATGNFLNNILASKKFKTLKMTKMIMEPSNRNWWGLNPDVTNAVHAPWMNDMTVPVGIMSLPFIETDRPMALNFGAMGSVIGHEMTHAFDTSGQYFNYEGVMNDWMTIATEQQFMRRAKCFAKQYDVYDISGYTISGNLTLNENIADNGGLQTSFYAFDLWRKDNPNSTTTNSKTWMDTFQISDEKLFFLGFSQMYCTKYTDHSLKLLSSHRHSPGPLRVKGTLSNFDTFGDTYSCPRNDHQCELW